MRLLQGGSGSGNYGHKGRPGLQGGSGRGLPRDTTTLELTPEEIEDLLSPVGFNNDEIDALDFYTGEGYEEINTYLRYSSGIPDSDTGRQIELLDSSISKVKPLNRDIVVYRATNDFPFSEGSIFSDRGFVSTSTSEYFKVDMIRYSNMQYLYRIKIPRGKKVLPIEESMENEVLLPRGSSFYVLSVRDNVIDLEML